MRCFFRNRIKIYIARDSVTSWVSFIGNASDSNINYYCSIFYHFGF